MYKEMRRVIRRARRMRLIRGPLSYNKNGLATTHNADFLRDPKFAEAYEEAARLTGWRHPAPWRVFFNIWAASHAIRSEGDLIECGVWHGFTALVVALYVGIDSTRSKFILIDSFEGVRTADLTPDERRQGMAKKNDIYLHNLEDVQRNFARFQNVEIMKGFVPEVLEEFEGENVGYVHIDMNYAAPELAAADFFWDRLIPGGVVVLDDYGFRKHKVQKEEFDKWAKKRGISICPLPTGQGFFLR